MYLFIKQRSKLCFILCSLLDTVDAEIATVLKELQLSEEDPTHAREGQHGQLSETLEKLTGNSQQLWEQRASGRGWKSQEWTAGWVNREAQRCMSATAQV